MALYLPAPSHRPARPCLADSILPFPSLPPNPYGELLPSSSLRLPGSAAVLVVSQTAMPFSVPSRWIPFGLDACDSVHLRWGCASYDGLSAYGLGLEPYPSHSSPVTQWVIDDVVLKYNLDGVVICYSVL